MTQRVLDVSALNEGTADSRALIWWGNLGMLAIEGSMFAMAMATYLYLRSTNLDWPPSTVPKPGLLMPTINTVMLLLSCIAAFVIDRASITKNMAAIRSGHIVSFIVGVTFLIIQYGVIVPDLGYKWSDHAYGSVIWTIIGLHTLHMVAATPNIALGAEFYTSTWVIGVEILQQPIVIENGATKVPTGPGLGVEVDEDSVRRISVAHFA